MNANPTMRRTLAFTLVELLTAMGIIALMLALVLQISGGALRTTRLAREQINANQNCRSVTDALASDLASVVTQNGAPILVNCDADQGYNLQLAFITARRASTSSGADSRWLAVAYQLVNHQVIRRVAPVPWSQTNYVNAINDAINNPAYSVIASSVLRFEGVVVLDAPATDGTATNNIEPLTSPGAWLSDKTANGTTVSPPVSPTSLALVLTDTPVVPATPRTQSLIVAVAAVDSPSFQILDGSGRLDDFVNTLQGGALLAGKTPADVWNGPVAKGQLANFPRPPVEALQMLQRTYNLR